MIPFSNVKGSPSQLLPGFINGTPFAFLLLLFALCVLGCSDDGPTQPTVTEPNARLLYWKLGNGGPVIQSINAYAGGSTDYMWGSLYAPVGGGRMALWRDPNDAEQITVVDVLTGEIVGSFSRQFGEAIEATTIALSPDGSKLVYTAIEFSAEWTYRMVVQDVADPNSFIVLPIGASAGSFVRFSPDGKQIAFYSRKDDVNREGSLNVINVDGTGLRSLGSIDEVMHDEAALMDWSPDGNFIVYPSWEFGVPELSTLHVVNVNTGASRVLAEDGLYPAWSPDGSKILYTSSFPEPNLYVVNSDGTGLRKLTSGTGTHGRWSPNGSMIACAEFSIVLDTPDPKPVINIVNATTGKTIRSIDSVWCHGFWYE